MINSNVDIIERLNIIWEGCQDNYLICNRKFAFSYVHPNPDILFIGINPSYIDGDKTPLDNLQPYCLSQTNNTYKKYFGKIENFATSVNRKWAYIDLLYYRETNQKMFYELSKNNLPFIVAQLKLTFEYLEYIKPKTIVVLNSLARKLMGKDSDSKRDVWMGYEFSKERDKVSGVFSIKGLQKDTVSDARETKLKNVPVLFYSNVHYMSKSEKERLVWQLNKVV